MNSFVRIAAAAALCALLVFAARPASAQFEQQGSKLFDAMGAIGTALQGSSVAISADGNTAIVGGPGDNSNVGAAWIYVRSGGVWTLQQKLVASDPCGASYQGSSVALSADGNIAAVGASKDDFNKGAVWIWTRTAGVWTQQTKLVANNAIGHAKQGTSVALSASGTTLLVGGSKDNSYAGAAWVWTYSEGEGWNNDAKLIGGSAVGNAKQGTSVALSSDGLIALIGGPDDNYCKGAVWAFVFSAGSWSQQAKLVGTGAVGASNQGVSVALSADASMALVGGSGDDGGEGAVWAFTRDGSIWAQMAHKLLPAGSDLALVGSSVALSADGATALIGGYSDNNGNGDGATWVYKLNESFVWIQQGTKLVGTGATGAAQQGRSIAVSADANTLIVGGDLDDSMKGAAWVFVQPPIAYVADPSSGSIFGGDVVTVYGTRFTGTTAVTFGGTPGTDLVVVDDSTVTVTTPAHATGSVDVVVVTEHGTSTISGGFFYALLPTTTSLSTSVNPSVFGQSITFTATVNSAEGAATGMVIFRDGGNYIGHATLSSGTAQITKSWLGVGLHSITAEYCGDSLFYGSTSSALSQIVNKGATATTLSTSQSHSNISQSVTFTATVAAASPANGYPCGTVTFMDGSTVLGTGTLSSGTATLSTTDLTQGTHAITAVYEGDNHFLGSTSPGVSQVVKKEATTTGLVATPTFTKPGLQVTLTATVGFPMMMDGARRGGLRDGAPPPPTGSVTFKDGSTAIGTVALSAGVATLNTTALTIGSHTITAQYGGTSVLAKSSSTANVTIDAKVGPEFRVNSTVANAQQFPAVTYLSNGNFVVAWASNAQDGSGYGIYAQRHNALGTRLGPEFRVNTRTIDNQTTPAIAALSNGGFVITWVSAGQDGSGQGVYGQRYSSAGVAAGSEFRVNTITASNQYQPSVAGLKNGGFVVVWTSNEPNAWGLGVYGQRYDASGQPAEDEFRISNSAREDQSAPSIAALTGGGFVVAWQTNPAGQPTRSIMAKRFNATGDPVGNEFRAYTAAMTEKGQPSVAGLKDNGFVVTWQSNTQDGSGFGIYGQRFNTNGARVGVEFGVNTATASDQSSPSVAAFPEGGFVVTWTSAGQDGSGQGVYAQAYDASGQRLDVEFRVNTTTARDQNQPAIAASTGGDFVPVWTSLLQDGSLEGVYGQRFNMPSVVTVDRRRDKIAAVQ